MGGQASRSKGRSLGTTQTQRRAAQGNRPQGRGSDPDPQGRTQLLPARLLFLRGEIQISLPSQRGPALARRGDRCNRRRLAEAPGRRPLKDLGCDALQFLPRHPARLKHRTGDGRSDRLARLHSARGCGNGVRGPQRARGRHRHHAHPQAAQGSSISRHRARLESASLPLRGADRV